jgi:chromosome segregation ATPase
MYDWSLSHSLASTAKTEQEASARADAARAEARISQAEKQAQVLTSELEDRKAAATRAELALQGAGGGAGGDVAERIAAMQKQLLEVHAQVRTQTDRAVGLEHAHSQVQAEYGELEIEWKACKDRLERSEREAEAHKAALASERDVARRLRAQADAERLHAQQQVNLLERQCNEARARGQASEDKVLALAGKLEHAQQQSKQLTAEVEALKERAAVLRRALDDVRVAKAKSEGEQRSMVASFRNEVRTLERQLAQEQHSVRELRREQRETAGGAHATASAQEESIRRERTEWQGRASALQAEVDAASLKAARLEDTSRAAQEECGVLKERVRELEEGAAAAYANYHDAEKARQAAEAQVSLLSQRNRQLTQAVGNDRQGLEDQLRASEEELGRLRKERQALARQMAVGNEKLELCQMEVDALARDKKRLQQLLDQLRAGGLPAGDVDSAGAEAQAIIRELRGALRSVQPQIKELQVECNQLRAEKEVVESQAESSKVYFQGQLRGRLQELQTAEAEAARLQEALEGQAAAVGRLEAANAALSQRLQEMQAAFASHPHQSQPAAPMGAGSGGSSRGGALGGNTAVGASGRPGTKMGIGLRMPGGPPLPTEGAPKRPRTKAAGGIGLDGGAGGATAAMPAWGTGTRWAPATGMGGAGGRTTPGGTLYQRPRSQVRVAGLGGAEVLVCKLAPCHK